VGWRAATAALEVVRVSTRSQRSEVDRRERCRAGTRGAGRDQLVELGDMGLKSGFGLGPARRVSMFMPCPWSSLPTHVPFQEIGRHSRSRHSPGRGSRPRSLRQRDSGPRPAIAGRRVRTPPPPRRCGWANRKWLGVGTRATAATELGRSGWPLGSASTARHGRVRQGALTRPGAGQRGCARARGTAESAAGRPARGCAIGVRS
jgi:hypothetical protein